MKIVPSHRMTFSSTVDRPSHLISYWPDLTQQGNGYIFRVSLGYLQINVCGSEFETKINRNWGLYIWLKI